MGVKCYCNTETIKLQVKKEGPNQHRYFLKCKTDKCKFWKWCDTDNYDTTKFKMGSCFRCGRYNCDATDCEETHDIFGNKIIDSE